MKMAREYASAEIVRLVENGEFSAGQKMLPENDLAERLGVSRSTVRSALKSLAKEGVINIEPGRGAFVGRGRMSSLMGNSVVILSTRTDNPLAFSGSGFSKATEAGVIRAAWQMGRNIQIICAQQMPPAEIELMRRGAADVVCMEEVLRLDCGRELFELLRGYPHVVFSGGREELAGFRRVTTDFEEISFLQTRWLIARGCRKIFCTWRADDMPYYLRQRYAGMVRALRGAGLEVFAPCDIRGIEDFREHPEHFLRYVKTAAGYLAEAVLHCGCDALVCDTDWSVPVYNEACRMLGRKPGRDIILAGFDNKCDTIAWCGSEPHLPAVTVDKHNDEAGEMLVDMLVDGRRECEAGRGVGEELRYVPAELVFPCEEGASSRYGLAAAGVAGERGAVRRLERGFTLIEVLVVVAIIGILAALLMPSLRIALDSAHLTYCANNQKNFGIGFGMYMNDYNNYLPTAHINPTYGYPLLNWPEFIFPYMGFSLEGINHDKRSTWPMPCPDIGGRAIDADDKVYSYARNSGMMSNFIFRLYGINSWGNRVKSPSRTLYVSEGWKESMGPGGGEGNFDFNRHGKMVTNLFLDWHVESMSDPLFETFPASYHNPASVSYIRNWGLFWGKE